MPMEHLTMPQPATNAATPFLFACDLSALSGAQRAAHIALASRLFGSLVQEVRELPDGFAFRFAGEHYEPVATFITNERRCCPFLSFNLDVAPHDGPVWLQLTAEGEVKPFLRAEFGHVLCEHC